MITVKINEKKSKIVGFVMDGHALSDDREYSQVRIRTVCPQNPVKSIYIARW